MDSFEGTTIATDLSEIDIDDFTQIAELPLKPDGENIFLYCDGFARNIQIETGTWDESGMNFIAECTVFAMTTLSPRDGINIKDQIPDTLPTLKLSYDNGSEKVVQYISQSSKNGSILRVNY